MKLAREFAIRARERLPKDSPEWRRATDIVLVSKPTPDEERRDRPRRLRWLAGHDPLGRVSQKPPIRPIWLHMTVCSPRRSPRLAAALSLTACQKADDAVFGQKVHAYLMAHPEVIREAADKLAENERMAAMKASTDAIGKYRGQLERDPRDFVANPNGKVTVVEFFDYRCGYCKLAAPEVVKLIQQNPDVRFVFKEFPIFGAVSDTAAKVALTREGQDQGRAALSGPDGRKGAG